MKITKEYLEKCKEAEERRDFRNKDENQRSFIGGRIDMLNDLISECDNDSNDNDNEQSTDVDKMPDWG